MSLFKSREWWAVNLNENEMYDAQSLLTVTLEGDKFQSIFLGNHKGVLRLFSPNSEPLQEGFLNYKPSHLLLEVQLAAPILQIGEGALVSGSPNIYLAVLHPRLFSVYTVKKKENKETNMDQTEIEVVYQHVLRHSAHSFVLGPFGGVRGRSFICIQSLDGLLSFYEQESFAFQLYLPTFILPFTFSYLEKIDSFLFLNGSLILDCYTYEALASVGSSNEKKIMKSWDWNLGEGILDINIVSKDGLLIVILSERNLYGLNENGKMIFMKRLDSKPVAFYSYVIEESKNLMIILATEEGFIHFYEEITLKWSMKIDQIPSTIKRIFLNRLPGGIVLLSEDGLLQVVYIGTHPSVYLVPPLVQPEIDIQKAEIELKQLQQKITDNDIFDPLTADLVAVDLKIDKTVRVENYVKCCNVMLEITAQCLISKIQVLFIVEPPLAVKSQGTTIFNCCDKAYLENSVHVNESCIASSLLLQLVVTYITNEGVMRSIHKNGTLPLELVVAETPPVKETLHKITITINKPVCAVNQLFREFPSDEASPNAIGLKLNSGDVVTILAAKLSQKYRLQADSLASISILLQALIERVKIHFQKESDFSMTYSGLLPMDGFFEKILHHQDLIKKKKNLEGVLAKQTSQYIVVQKKVLSDLKDVTPKSSNLYNLLKDTSRMIKTSIEELENVEKEMFFSRSCIRSMARLMVTLLELQSVRDDDLRILKIVFNPNVEDEEDQGWLEVQEAAMSFLLRTILAKSVKDQQKPHEILLEPLADTSKITKHFASVIDRVTKGTYLLERNDFDGKKEPLMTIQSAYESDENLFDDVIPTTSKLLSGYNSNVKKMTPKTETHTGTSDLAVVEEKHEEVEESSGMNLDVGKELSEEPEVKADSDQGAVLERKGTWNDGKDDYEDDDGQCYLQRMLEGTSSNYLLGRIYLNISAAKQTIILIKIAKEKQKKALKTADDSEEIFENSAEGSVNGFRRKTLKR